MNELLSLLEARENFNKTAFGNKVAQLKEKGQDLNSFFTVNADLYYERTILGAAIALGNVDAVKILIQQGGISPNASVDRSNEIITTTALGLAAECDQMDVIRALVHNLGANPHTPFSISPDGTVIQVTGSSPETEELLQNLRRASSEVKAMECFPLDGSSKTDFSMLR